MTTGSTSNNFATYESLEKFQSFIDLTKQNLTFSFVKSILNRAVKKFHNESDMSGLVYKDNLVFKIRQEFKDKIENPKSRTELLLLTGPSFATWVHVGKEVIWTRGPVFNEVTDENIYHWTSQIAYVRLYEKKKTSLDDITRESERRLMVLTVDVNWKAQVRSDGRFFHCEVTGYREASYSFEAPTQDKLNQYKIEDTFQKEGEAGVVPGAPERLRESSG